MKIRLPFENGIILEFDIEDSTCLASKEFKAVVGAINHFALEEAKWHTPNGEIPTTVDQETIN